MPVGESSIAWTGTEVLVIGGNIQASNGIQSVTTALAYNPANNTWRRLADMPLPRTAPMAQWTGHQLIVWGGYTWSTVAGDTPEPPFGFAYDPTTNYWASLPAAPLRDRTDAVSVWTGSEMLVWGSGVLGSSDMDGAAFRPAAG